MRETQQLAVDVILGRFFEEQLKGMAGANRERIELVERRLRECIEAEGERVLSGDDLELLAAEREFGPYGAVARVMRKEAFVVVLTLFLDTPWLPKGLMQARKQVRLVDGLTHRLIAAPPVMGKDVLPAMQALGRAIQREDARLQPNPHGKRGTASLGDA